MFLARFDIWLFIADTEKLGFSDVLRLTLILFFPNVSAGVNHVETMV